MSKREADAQKLRCAIQTLVPTMRSLRLTPEEVSAWREVVVIGSDVAAFALPRIRPGHVMSVVKANHRLTVAWMEKRDSE